MRVALAQIGPVLGETDRNLQRAADAIDEAVVGGADLYDSATYWSDITAFYARMYQCYVVFVNRVGDEGERRFWGRSHLFDPWGQVVAEAPRFEESLVLVDIDLGRIRKRRREVPLVEEARLGLVEREVRRLVEEGGDL